MAIECPICVRPCSSRDYSRHHIKFTLALLNDEPEPVCELFELKKFRGLDGVVDHRAVPSRFVEEGPLFSRQKRSGDVG